MRNAHPLERTAFTADIYRALNDFQRRHRLSSPEGFGVSVVLRDGHAPVFRNHMPDGSLTQVENYAVFPRNGEKRLNDLFASPAQGQTFEHEDRLQLLEYILRQKTYDALEMALNSEEALPIKLLSYEEGRCLITFHDPLDDEDTTSYVTLEILQDDLEFFIEALESDYEEDKLFGTVLKNYETLLDALTKVDPSYDIDVQHAADQATSAGENDFDEGLDTPRAA